MSVLLYGLEQDRDFHSLDARLLVSCPVGLDEGGLYLLDFKTNSLKKLYTGGCMGMTRVKDRFIVATNDNKIVSLNDRFEPISITGHQDLDFHGVAKLSDTVVLVVETAINAIGCYEIETLKRVGEIRINPTNADIHHINDIWFENQILYVSMFSLYSTWYDNPKEKIGGIIAIDLAGFRPDTRLDINTANHVVVGELHMPHTVMLHEGRLAYCDSMSFSVTAGEPTNIQLMGFTRGLAFTNNMIFIGQSRMRHILRVPHEFSNCCLESGIYVYMPKSRTSRFVTLPVKQVYQILIMDPIV